MANNVKVVNNAEKDVVVTINKENEDIQIVIDLAGNKVELSTVDAGKVIKGKTGREYIVFKRKDNDSSMILKKELLDNDMRFDNDCNNLITSSLLKYLHDTYIKEIEEDFGADSIVPHETDLLSLDGLDDYKTTLNLVSLLTIDDYRYARKNKIIKKNMDRSWWLATPDSTPSGYGSGSVRCVSSDGRVGYDGYDWDHGVRPFFALKSSILVSCSEIC